MTKIREKVAGFLKRLREKVSAGVLAMILSVATLAGIIIPGVGQPISGGAQSVTNRMADVVVTTGNVTLQANDAWVGAGASAPRITFDGTADELAILMDSGGAWTFYGHATSPNMVGGHAGNSVSGGVYGATIAGGGAAVGASYNTVTALYGTVGGGLANSASEDAVVAGGMANSATGYGTAVGGGEYNYAGDAYGDIYACVPCGFANMVTEQYGTAIGGRENQVTSVNGTAQGYLAKSERFGEVAQASGAFSVAGDAQHSSMVLRRLRNHSSTGWHDLYLDGASELMTIPDDGLLNADIKIVGETNGSAQRWAYNLQCVIVNDGGTTTLLYSNTDTLVESDANYDAQCLADDANDALLVQVGRSAGTGYTIRWAAVVDLIQVTY